MRIARAAAAVLAALVIGGCGSSKPSAHDAFVAKANAICAKAQERAKELGKRTGGASSRDFTPAQALIAVTGLALSRVQPPAAQRAAYHQFLASVQREARYVAALGRYERKKDRSAAHAVLAKMEANPVNSEARALGLAKCAETVEPSR